MAANPVELDLALHQSLPDLLRNLLPNPVAPPLALHQSLPEPFPELCWTWPGSAPKPPRPSPEPSPEPCWILAGSAPNKVRNPVEPDLALHQSLPEPSPEPSSEPCWTWPGSAPNPLRPSRNPVEPDLALHESLPDLHRNLLRTLLNLTWLCAEASQTFSGTFSVDLALHQAFSGTFSGTLLNLAWLCTKASWTRSAPKPARPSPEPSEPSPEPRWTWPGTCTSAHRSYCGLKTPLAYAVGEKLKLESPQHLNFRIRFERCDLGKPPFELILEGQGILKNPIFESPPSNAFEYLHMSACLFTSESTGRLIYTCSYLWL